MNLREIKRALDDHKLLFNPDWLGSSDDSEFIEWDVEYKRLAYLYNAQLLTGGLC